MYKSLAGATMALAAALVSLAAFAGERPADKMMADATKPTIGETLSPALQTDGVIRVRSAYPLEETIARIKQDIAAKGIKFFDEIDQTKLGGDAGIKLRPSTLLIFGNPPLGIQFLASNPNAGLDWPVRLLAMQDDKGDVYAAYTDFAWIAQRHGITDREAQFKMASSVVSSILSTVTAK